jgi:hypothetical protein
MRFVNVVAQRLSAQLLSGTPASNVIDVIDRILAVQAQDLRGARLAIRVRSTGLRASDVDEVLNNRAAVITWLNRGTLHLIRAEDYWWMQALMTPPLLTQSARRLGQEGVPPAAADKGIKAIERAVTADGPLTRGELRERVAKVGVRTEAQAMVHLLFAASLRGLIVRGPMKGNEQAFVLVRDWLGKPEKVDRDVALAELVRRYLVGHGPANERDLVRWSRLNLGDVRRGFAANATSLVDRGDGLVDLRSERRGMRVPPPKLFGPWDPLLLGWASRELLLDPQFTNVVTDNGIFRPFALVNGRVVATWSIVNKRVTLASPLAPVAMQDLGALEREAADVQRFLFG